MAAIGLFAILILSQPVSPAGETAYELYSIGNNCELSGDIEKAVEYYEQALALDTSAVEIYLALSTACYRLRRYDEGVRWATRALAHADDQSKVHMNIATGYIGKGDYKSALDAYQKARSAKPGDIEMVSAVATLLEVTGDPAEASRVLLDVPEGQKTAEVYIQLAEIAGRQKDHGGAVDYYRKAIFMDSTNATSLVGAGTGFDLLGVKDSSIMYYEKATALGPQPAVDRRLIDLYSDTEQYEKLIAAARSLLEQDYYENAARRNLGYALFKTGRTAEALAEFLLASRIEPDDTYSRFYVARLYLEQGKYAEAKEEVKAALAINPDFIELWVYLGFITMDLKEYDAAEDAFAEAAYRGGDLVQIHYLNGVIGEFKERPDRAYFDYRRSLALDPLSTPALEALANLCDRLGRKNEAFGHFRRLMEIDSTNAIALNYVGYTYAERAESLDYALALIERALTQEPDNGYYLDSRGWAYYQTGQYEAALADIERAVMLVDDSVILEHLGDVYFKLGELSKARAAYEKAFEKDPGNKDLLRKLRKMK